jgi:hypothetical protein
MRETENSRSNQLVTCDKAVFTYLELVEISRLSSKW